MHHLFGDTIEQEQEGKGKGIGIGEEGGRKFLLTELQMA